MKPLPADDLAHVSAHTRKLWAEARGSRFFLTGGTGFFGIWLLESFARINAELDLGMRATVLTRSPAAFAAKAPHLAAAPDFDWLQGDIRTFPYPSGRYEYVIHAAADATPPQTTGESAELFDSIVFGTRRLLDFAAQAGAKKLLLTSSGAVYGKQPADLPHLPEEYTGAPDPLEPGSAYGEGKRVAEYLCSERACRQGFEAKIARCFAFMGPHLPLEGRFAIGNFLRDAQAGGPIRVGGDGTPRRSYLYAADLAVWLWTILFRGLPQRAYNVGSAEDVAIVDLASRVALLAGAGPVQVAGIPVPGVGPSRYVPKVDRAAVELGLRVRICLEDAILRSLAWTRQSNSSLR